MTMTANLGLSQHGPANSALSLTLLRAAVLSDARWAFNFGINH